jgi:hypothetical protein
MTVQVAGTSVTTSIDVEVPIKRAFAIFTDGIGTWWDPSHHILEAELAEMVFEPYVGGNIVSGPRRGCPANERFLGS